VVRFAHTKVAVHRGLVAAVEVDTEQAVAAASVLAGHTGSVVEVAQVAAEDEELPWETVHTVLVGLAAAEAAHLDSPAHRSLDIP
jgi:hypothetical protein